MGMLPFLLIPIGITALLGIGSSIEGAIRINEANERMQRRQRRLKDCSDKAVPVLRCAMLLVESLQKERLDCLCTLRDSATVLGSLSRNKMADAVLAAEGISHAHLQTWNAMSVDDGEILTNIGARVAGSCFANIVPASFLRHLEVQE